MKQKYFFFLIPVALILMAMTAVAATGVYTGLVIDTTGLSYRPALSPTVYDENGIEVYGSMYVSREYAEKQGIAGYAKSVDQAVQNPRVGDNPLVVKATRVWGKSGVVISNEDAVLIRKLSKHLSFLEKCKVILVVD